MFWGLVAGRTLGPASIIFTLATGMPGEEQMRRIAVRKLGITGHESVKTKNEVKKEKNQKS